MRRLLFIVILVTGCIDPYFPPEIDSTEPILVIDGFIDTQGTSTIRLTRTQTLTEEGLPQPVTGATLWIEDTQGLKTFLIETGEGNYELPSQSFSSATYRLSIRTAQGKEYVSDFVAVKNSPPIDSLSWGLTSDQGVEIFVSTHDPETEEGYYRWTFEETWLYTSAGQSTYVFDPVTRAVTVREEDIYHCWRNDRSSDILVGNTTRLSENRISEFPLTYIPQTSERTRYKYSILVSQYSITQSAYNYWQQIKKTTEDLGTLFGPLPSQVVGNYTCITNPSEPVLGYFAIGTVSRQRLFIPWQELPTPSSYETPYDQCEVWEILLENFYTFNGSPFLLLYGIPNPNGPGIIGYYYATESCADCRLTGGTTTKPDFWE